MKPDTNNLMIHFRWITPLLGALSLFFLQQIYSEFRQMKSDIQELKTNYATMRTFLVKNLN